MYILYVHYENSKCPTTHCRAQCNYLLQTILQKATSKDTFKLSIGVQYNEIKI